MKRDTRLACYRLLKVLGQGSWSTVYLAQGILTKKLCAVKVFDRGDRVAALHHFSRELDILSSISHPNLVELLDFGQTLDTGDNFLTLEYLSGDHFVAASKVVSQHHFYAMLAQICRGLDRLHSRGITHGDLKPQNVLTAPDAISRGNPPLVKVLDLGYGKHPTSISDGILEGSAHYLAPEVIQGQAPTIASDLYSLGIILYECLAGAPPFGSDDAGTVLQNHLQQPPPPIEVDSLKDLHPVAYHLLSKDPAKRPHSAAELLRMINAVSPVGQFRLHTADTCTASARSLPLVGREPIISDVSRLLTEMHGESRGLRPYCILLGGERGVGKSRILRHIAQRAHSSGFRTLNLSGHSGKGSLPFASDAVSATIMESSERPLLLAYDGFTGSKAELELLHAAISIQNRVALILLTVDTSQVSAESLHSVACDLAPDTRMIEWTIRPLEPSQVAEIVATDLSSSQPDTTLASWLHDQSGGNPLVLCELLALYWDQQTGSHPVSSIRRIDSTLQDKVPAKVTDHLTHMCSRFSVEESAVVQLLAAAADRLTCSDIGRLTHLSDDVVSHICAVLSRRGILRATPGGDHEGFKLSGELLRARILSDIETRVKTRIHEQLARWYLKCQSAPRSTERAARNFAAAGLQEEALVYFVRAADEASQASEHQRATELYSSAIALNPIHPRTKTELDVALADSLIYLGRLGEAKRILDRIPNVDGFPHKVRASVHMCRANCAKAMGDFPTFEQEARIALAIAKHAGLESESIEAMLKLGSALCWLERRREGRRLLFKAASMARRANYPLIAAQALRDVGSSLWKAGDYRLALNYERRRYRLVCGREDLLADGGVLVNIGILQSDLGSYVRARNSHRAALKLARRFEMQARACEALINLGETHRCQGSWGEAVNQYRGALSSMQDSGAGLLLLIAEANVAHVSGRVAYYSESIKQLKHKIRVALSHGALQAVFNILPTWGLVLLSVGRFASAEKLAAHTSRIAGEAQVWQSMLELGVLRALAFAGMGRNEEARGLLGEAMEKYDGRSPFDTRLSARIAKAQIERALGASLEAVEEIVGPALQTARMKKMRWHLIWALMVRGEALLAVNRGEEGEPALQEAVGLATEIGDRTMFWQAAFLLGRIYEQMLRYERALAYYRVSALTIHEIGMNIEEERYKASFLNQPRVREVSERYERLGGQVGKQARYDLALMSRSEKVSRKMLGALNSIGQKLSSILDLDELMRSILDLAIENVRAERGMIFLRDEMTGELRAARARGMDGEELDEVASFSRSVVQQVARGQTLLTVDVGKDPALSTNKSLVLHQIKSILCVPMRTRGNVVGVIHLDTRRAAQLFTDRERAFVEAFASQAAIAIENARLFGHMNAENARLRHEAAGRGRFENLIGTSTAMRKLSEVIGGVLGSDCNVLLIGESGTGKELVARAIHYNSPRQAKSFVAVDCGALPENLLESELFGYARGAFTGAERDRVGLIEEAHRGTLFLDEITNTSVALQARLLRLLQEQEVRRLGENKPRSVDVRVVAATNADLKKLMAEGRFRQDLYYRLNVVAIEVPALRERREDIPLLVNHFLKAHTTKGQALKRLGPGVIDLMVRHDWPGNVRELRNVVERMVVLSSGTIVTVADLPEGLRPAAAGSGIIGPGDGNGDGHKTGEQLMIEDVLRRYGGDKAKAARFIGWNRQKLYRRMRSFGIASDYGRMV